MLTVVQTAVGAGAQDAGLSRLPSTDGNGGTQQVAVGLNALCPAKDFGNESAHNSFKLRTNAASVEVNLRGRLFLLEKTVGRQQFARQDGTDVLLRLVERIDALRLQAAGHLPVGEQSPVSLGTPTVSNQNLHIFRCRYRFVLQR